MTEEELKLEKTLEEGGELVDEIVTKLREEHFTNTPHSG